MFTCRYRFSIIQNLPLTPSFIQCLARKVPELCKPYTPGKTEQDLGLRISRLEHIIELALPQFCPPGTPLSADFHHSDNRYRSSSVGDDETQSQGDEQDPGSGTFQSGKWYGNGASGSVATASLIEQVRMFRVC